MREGQEEKREANPARTDPERKKYFKIEKNHTTPRGAAWSADSVKRRRLEDEEGARALRRADADRGRVARARVLSHALAGGFLDRELFGPLGDAGGGCRAAAAPARVRDHPPAAFAAGLKPAGKIPLKDARWASSRSNVDHLVVDNQDANTDMCVAFASESPLFFCFFPEECRLPFNLTFGLTKTLSEMQPPTNRLSYPPTCPGTETTGKFHHRPSSKVLVANGYSPSRVASIVVCRQITEPAHLVCGYLYTPLFPPL